MTKATKILLGPSQVGYFTLHALCNYPQAEPIYAVDLAEGISHEVLRGKQARDKPCCGVAKALKTTASLRANFFAALGSPRTSSFTAGMPWSRSRCRSPCARRPPTILLHAPQRDCPSDDEHEERNPPNPGAPRGVWIRAGGQCPDACSAKADL